jgi:hypothetical protein
MNKSINEELSLPGLVGKIYMSILDYRKVYSLETTRAVFPSKKLLLLLSKRTIISRTTYEEYTFFELEICGFLYDRFSLPGNKSFNQYYKLIR